jgi:malate dehydrogenase
VTTVSIIGAGDVGGACAHALARRDIVSRVLLVDGTARVAAGKALDIQQSAPVDGFHTRVDGTDDPTRIAGSAVCIVADRFGSPSSDWSGEDALAHFSRLRTDIGSAVLVCAGATQAALPLSLTREGGFRRERVIASAPEAFSAAIRSIVAIEARCSPADVMLTVLGAPPRFVVPWSEASIGGYALERVLTPPQVARIDARAEKLWPPGPYALGAAAARIVEAIISSSRQTMTVLTLLTGEFGIRNRVGALPVLLAPAGVAEVRVPTLHPRERVLVETALGE